jgi:hypothetical protein
VYGLGLQDELQANCEAGRVKVKFKVKQKANLRIGCYHDPSAPALLLQLGSLQHFEAGSN